MSRGLNKVLVIGNLGHDPEVRYTASGKAVTSFSLAASRSWVTAAGERKEATEWFRVVAWGNLAEICGRFLSKGSRVYIEGQLQTRSWDNQGQKHYTTEVVAKELIILDARGKEPEPEYRAEEWEAEPSQTGPEPLA